MPAVSSASRLHLTGGKLYVLKGKKQPKEKLVVSHIRKHRIPGLT